MLVCEIIINQVIMNNKSKNKIQLIPKQEQIGLKSNTCYNESKGRQIGKCLIQKWNENRQQSQQQIIQKIEQLMRKLSKQYNDAIQSIEASKTREGSHHKLLLQIDGEWQEQQRQYRVSEQQKSIKKCSAQQNNTVIQLQLQLKLQQLQLQNKKQVEQYNNNDDNNNNSMYSIIDIEWHNENEDVMGEYGKHQVSEQQQHYVKQWQQETHEQVSDIQQYEEEQYQQIQYNHTQATQQCQAHTQIVQYSNMYNSSNNSNDVMHLRNKLQLKSQQICYMQITHSNHIAQLKSQLSSKNQLIRSLQVQLQQLAASHLKYIKQILVVHQNKQGQLSQFIRQLQSENAIYRNKWAHIEKQLNQMKDKYYKLQYEMQSKQAEYQKIYDNYDQLLAKLNAYVKLVKRQSQHNCKPQHKKSKQSSQQHNTQTNSKVCEQLYSQLEEQYVQKMSQHLHSQSKSLKHKEIYLAQIKHQNTILNMQINKCEQKIEAKDKEIRALNQIISHYKASRKTDLDIYVQQEIEYLRAEVVHLNRKLENKEKEMRSKWVKKHKQQLKQLANRKQCRDNCNRFKQQNENQLSGAECSSYDQKRLVQKLAEYEEFIILTTLKHQGIGGHCCKLSKQYDKNKQEFTCIQADIAQHLKNKQKRERHFDNCQQQYSNNEQHKQNKCKKCYNILSSALRLCAKFNAQIICNYNKQQNHRNMRNRKLVRVASQTYDDSVIYQRCSDNYYHETTIESKQV